MREERMAWIGRRQRAPELVNRFDDGRAKLADFRIDAAEQRAVRLSAAANRLVEIFAARQMDRTEQLRQFVPVADTFAEIGYPNECLVAFEPMGPRVADNPPRRRGIGPQFGRLRAL